jgi:hypothetical protein
MRPIHHSHTAFALLTARFVGAVLGWESAPSISRLWVIIAMAGLFLATRLATLWSLMKRKDFAAAILPGAGLAVVFLFVAVVVYPMANAFKSSREFAGLSPRRRANRELMPATI